MSFEETQKFPNWSIWLGRGLVVLMAAVFVVIYLSLGMSGILILFMLIAFLCSAGPCLLLELARLKTKVDSTGIRLALKPLTKKQYVWSDIQSAEMIDYGFVGGWGIRMGTKYGTVYNARGSQGVWLTLKTGKKIVIGTQRTTDWQNAIDKYLP